MSPRPLNELVSPDWAEALQPVAATITAMGAFLRAELAAGRATCRPVSMCCAPSAAR